MIKAIQVRIEGRRGCGYRDKPGSLYLVSYGPRVPCGRLPIPLDVCPTCGHGFKPSRGWTWVQADRLAENVRKKKCKQPFCELCPISRMLKGEVNRSGLIWIGEQYYKTPRDFLFETDRMGISRRIICVPRGFKLGETWVLLAHRKAIPKHPEFGKELEYIPGVFQVFKPEAVEVICSGKESKKKVDEYLKKGYTPIKVEKRDESNPGMRILL